MEFYNTVSKPRKNGDEPKLRYQEFFPRVWAALKIALIIDELTTSISPKDVMNCNNIKTSSASTTAYSELINTPSCPELTVGRTVRSQFSVRLKLFLRLTVPESFVGSCHLRPDWRIGKLLRYPTTGKWNFRRPQSCSNRFKWPKGSWFVTQRSGRLYDSLTYKVK